MMRYVITCPYCFRGMYDDQVKFRSELVHHGEPAFIPDEYEDFEDFQLRYHGADKQGILNAYQDWAFFNEVEDPVYEAFWANYNGTTEYNPADDLLNVKAYHRRVIDPTKDSHRRYLKPQPDGTYFIRDMQGMVSQIELVTGERCNRRVCRHCHNPLPVNYGKNPVKFVTIIGIVGSGKTVYLSQLLRRMRTYAVKVGLNAIVTNAGVRTFLENNSVVANEPLPGATPFSRLQQPLFYEMIRDAGVHGRVTETFVLYDVPGEVFNNETPELVHRFAPFIKHADGAIVLIDPMQFEVISETTRTRRQLDHPTIALNTIHHIISQGNVTEKSNTPFAICLSKADMKEVQNVLSDELRDMLLSDVRGIEGTNGFYLPLFNAKDYAPIAIELTKFIKSNELALAQMMETNYSSYAYFAFTALGCDVKEAVKDTGESYEYPVGPVLPKRVEEPLLWLFYKLGYIGKNAPIPGEVYCPVCGSHNNYELPEDERIIVERQGFLKKRVERYVNRCCYDCGCKWDYSSNN